jgi:hypothetical protein
MDHYINTAYDVTTQIFGPDSGIPGWAWLFVLVALFWKILIPEPKTARQSSDERDAEMLGELFGDGKKGKKDKKKK